MEENDKPEQEEKEKDDQLEDLTPEKDPMGGALLSGGPLPNAQKREVS
ncbi:MAG: hypothetical protein H0T95_11350 [Chthoniobacterales bacterium]|nr:hypothetical protein [Chthoniobacterales bacterium]